MLNRKVIDRFWWKVSKSEAPNACWLWTAATADGYGTYWVDERPKLAHRVSWEIAYGSPPSRDLAHTCGNRKCVNPEHLKISDTPRGTGPRHRVNSKNLKKSDVRKIITLRSKGTTQKALAKKFGVSRIHVWRICNGLSWPSVHAELTKVPSATAAPQVTG